MDPRYRYRCGILNKEDDVKKTVQTLANLWNRVNNIMVNSTNELNRSALSDELNTSVEFDKLDLDKYLDCGAMIPNIGSSSLSPDHIGRTMNIESEIESFQPDKLSTDESVIEYWDSVKEEHPRLYEIALILYAIPQTEVQIERDFSSLEFIFNPRRFQLSPELLEAALTIHLNAGLFKIIKSEELYNLRDVCNSRDVVSV